MRFLVAVVSVDFRLPVVCQTSLFVFFVHCRSLFFFGTLLHLFVIFVVLFRLLFVAFVFEAVFALRDVCRKVLRPVVFFVSVVFPILLSPVVPVLLLLVRLVGPFSGPVGGVI